MAKAEGLVPTSAHYPVACPQCGAVAGYARAVRSEDSPWFLIDLRCDACQHKWSERKNMALPVRLRRLPS